jgi:hypothetical protein
MPVTGTPIDVPEPGTEVCSDQLNVAPITTAVEGREVPTKMRSVEVSAGQAATIQFVMRNKNGDPVNLSTCIPPGSVELRLRESLQPNAGSEIITIVGSVVSATEGIVQATLTPEAVEMPGISIGEFGVLNADDELIFSNMLYIVVNRSFWANEVNDYGPLSIAEIRLQLRDSGPEDNIWLDVEEFDLSEIAASIERPIRYWNESAPPLDIFYSTATFPFRYHWMEGTVACLYRIAATHYRRVHLPYSAGGVSVDDKNKAQEYEVIAERKWKTYTDWVQWKKVQLNCEAAVQSTGSLYSTASWVW